MRTVAGLVLLLILGCYPAVSLADDGEESATPSDDSDVIILTDQNFDEITQSGSFLIEFFAPWCGHCKKLKPIFEEVATLLEGKISLASVDCTEQKGLAQRFDVKSYPTLKFWRDGEARVYKGARSREALLKFGLDVSKPAVEEVDAQSLKNLTSEQPVSFIVFAGDSGSSSDQAKKSFERVAYQLQGQHKFLRAKAHDLKLFKRYSVEDDGKPVVVCHREGGFDEKFTGPWLETALRSFVDRHKLPLVSDLDQTNFEDVTNSGQIIVFATSDPAASSTKAFSKALLNVARKYRQFTFANVDGVKFAKYVAQFGVSQAQLPTVFALNYTGDQYYLADAQAATESQIEAFVNGILSGRVPARDTASWYSPWRYYKAFEKWLGSFTESQLATATIVAMLLFAVIIFAGCYYAAQDLFTPDPAEEKAGAAPKAEGKVTTSTIPVKRVSAENLRKRKDA